MLLSLILPFLAQATVEYDPSAPVKVYTGKETYTQDGTLRLWSAIELHKDGDTQLFGQDEFNSMTEWPSESKWAPWIATCFGTQTPHSSTFLLHLGPNEATASGTPILFVPGAGDNGSRGFITMATHMDTLGRPVYAMTFAHPHGDIFQHAESIADAIARIKERTGAEKVDVVAHSKGGPAAAVYVSHTTSADWGGVPYESLGTPYRDDVRKLVLIAAPLGGVDTSYRWSDINYLLTDPDLAMAPSSWELYYPYGSASWWLETDMSTQDFFAEGGDLFPGQRQLLARQEDYPLPGSLSWMGVYSLQQDWYTTYEGGYGYYSYSSGIDAAIEDGGNFVAHLEAQGVDPEVQLYLLGGENPIMPNGTEDFLALSMGEAWVDMATASSDLWAALLADLVGNGLVSVGFSEAEVQGLVQGKLILGEISGPSDGLVFLTSALKTEALTARGAVVVDTRRANLSHLDLLYASPITGELLIAQAEADPVEDGWKAGVGARYVEEDTIGWVREALADEAGPDDSGLDDSGLDDSGAGDSGEPQETGGDDSSSSDDSSPADDTGVSGGDKRGCTSAPGRSGILGLCLSALALMRRRRT